ncbi:MAG: D-glycerate dehydrogenase [Solirubrobacterales bacterium]
MPRIFVTRKLPGDALGRLADAGHEVDVWNGELPPPRDELLGRTTTAEGLLCLLTDRVDAELLDACPELRAVANMAVGTDNIDLAECAQRGISVGNTPGVLTEATADLAFALILASARHLIEAAGSVRAGRWRTWEPAGWLGQDVHGATLGIIGLGKIGRAMARRSEGFGMRLLHHDRTSGMSLDTVLADSDFVSIHCPLTEQTRGLIGERELRQMKPTATLVNTARGEIVDPRALATALREGWIAGAALDVTDPEPLAPDDPLLQAPNLIVLPHIGSASHATREAMADLAVDNLIAALAGRAMPNPVGES